MGFKASKWNFIHIFLDINLLTSLFAVVQPLTEGTIPFYCNNKKLFQEMNFAIVEIENLVFSY